MDIEIEKALLALTEAVADIQKSLKCELPPAANITPQPTILEPTIMTQWCRDNDVDFNMGIKALPNGWKWGKDRALEGLFCIFPDSWKYRSPDYITKADVDAIAKTPPAFPDIKAVDELHDELLNGDMTRDEALKWCVENKPNFNATVLDTVPPQGWFWETRMDTNDKVLINENRSDSIVKADVMKFVDPVDIIEDEILSRDDAIEWCITNLINFNRVSADTTPPMGWGFDYNAATGFTTMVCDDGVVCPIGEDELKHHIDKQLQLDVGMNRAEMINWLKDNSIKWGADENTPLPTGWEWDRCNGEDTFQIVSIITPINV